MKRPIKNLLGRLMFTSHFYQVLLRSAGVVVAFHRIKDASEDDALTVSAAMFERHCRFFRRHFDVVPLRTLVDRLEAGRSLEGQLAITFDDGYLDNFENAAPVLSSLSLPATFFVVSQWLGSDVVPWWDSANGVRHPWMTWDHVKALHANGFDIGAHTRTHADLGNVRDHEARDEIGGARLELETGLHTSIDLFAYPYGRRHNLVEANRALVREAGYRCCCSCFGGVVAAGTDPFHIRRIPISSWYASPQEFGFELALGTSTLSS